MNESASMNEITAFQANVSALTASLHWPPHQCGVGFAHPALLQLGNLGVGKALGTCKLSRIGWLDQP